MADPTTERVLRIEGLCARVADIDILTGIDLEVRPGEVHAVMGPNGSGKSTLAHVLMGRPGYEVTAGSISLDGVDLLELEPWERAQAGLFLAMQHPTAVHGVGLEAMLVEAARAGGRDTDSVRAAMVVEAARIGFDEKLLDRHVNADLSGGEKKRNETLQLAVIGPRYAVLDEIDSGLDVDALAAVSRRVQDATRESGLGVLAITHFSRLLEVLEADTVHVLYGGRIRLTGGPELSGRLEAEGYAGVLGKTPEPAPAPSGAGFGDDPFTDPLG